MKLSWSVCFVLFLASSASAAPVPMANYTEPIKVACVGDSITAGYGVDAAWSYAGQLSRLLGDKWEVHSFGVSGSTMLKKSDNSYWNHKEYPAALALQPDVVIIELGTNDTKPENWNQQNFVSDYLQMIQAFQALPNKPLIYLCLPVPVAPPGNYNIPLTGPTELIPLITQLAGQNHCDLIDFNTAMAPHLDWLPDHVHPEPDGGFLMAKVAYAALTGTEYTGGMLLTTQGPHPHRAPQPAAVPAPSPTTPTVPTVPTVPTPASK